MYVYITAMYVYRIAFCVYHVYAPSLAWRAASVLPNAGSMFVYNCTNVPAVGRSVSELLGCA